MATIPNLPAVSFSLARGRSLLWEAVGEAAFREMIDEAPQTG